MMQNFKMSSLFLLLFGLFSFSLMAQNGGLRGTLLDDETGMPIPFTPVYLNNGEYNALSGDDGFYTIANVPPGNYQLKCRSLGYDSLVVDVEVIAGKFITVNLNMLPSAQQVGIVTVDADKEKAQNTVRVSVVQVTPKDIKRLPSTGGEADIAQYLQVIPGIVFTGDQGGQFYIRGGAPVQNKILLDGMTISNAFHSIGFFSVFETELIRSADVYTGGFSAKYGGRSSAIVDIRTRDGNKKRTAGMISVNPFVAKALIEGPIIPLGDDGGSSLSYFVTAKHSYLNESSKLLYKSILSREGTAVSDSTLPYSFTDFHAKLSFNAANGSRLNAYGFSHNDVANFGDVAKYSWNSAGGGINFRIVPGAAKIIMDGTLAYSLYGSNFEEGDGSRERRSDISNFNANFNFTYYMGLSRELNYGLEFNSIGTDFAFVNNNGIPIGQTQSNTEVAGYIRYQGRFGNLVIEPSLRAQYYASLGEFRAEPRLGLKYNITENIRIKMAGGMYSQNLISSVDERDVVNLFVGFLGGPDQQVFRITGYDEESQSPIYEATDSKLQTSIHAIGGIEFDAGKHLVFNVEPYIKWFPQIIGLNRNRTADTDQLQPTYITEEGKAYGLDLSGTYEKDQLYLYLAYSLGHVRRDDGLQEFPAHFDRRHNLNFVGSYKLKFKSLPEDLPAEERRRRTEYPLELSIRWNLGSGFPFTETQGFFTNYSFQDGINSDYITANNNPDTELGVLYSDELNGGRLPYYHRLDFSATYTFDLGRYSKLLLNASVTNMYDRANIFYFDRVRYQRVNQLPILPALGAVLKF
ncbi:outer membrane receptor for ferrienterochelin and colicins [Saprospira grandis DSM 2844]|uniref:Outer membrane receptor for ferrienterochelin and colicins n=1 Tax=Saprospira grandis DSM 2844 TaxID=694433 RepID=J0P4S3_9BACT|nr:TonB-dependent receptor plug domain-containing protein [Saprospira grandis]EJF52432.1 outer membrane receptor for ferrienterochelin and colicins [Saprospira grandis DSM 2844]